MSVMFIVLGTVAAAGGIAVQAVRHVRRPRADRSARRRSSPGGC